MIKMADMIFFELTSFKEFLIGISCTPGLYINHLRLFNKHVYFSITTLGSHNEKAFFYCILNKKLPFSWINFNPRTLEYRNVKKPLHGPNLNISIVECKKISFIEDLVKFINS